MESQRHPYSRALLSAVLFPDPKRRPDPYVIEGEIPTAINPKPECPLYGRCPIREDACQEAVPPLVEVEGSALFRLPALGRRRRVDGGRACDGVAKRCARCGARQQEAVIAEI